MPEQTTATDRLLTPEDVQRLGDASLRGGREAWLVEIERLICERSAAALRDAALSVPMGPRPDPADYLGEVAEVWDSRGHALAALRG